jgi:hypothetical protein
MNFRMTEALARQHMRDVRDQAVRCRGRSSRPRPDLAVRVARWPRLRKQVGYRLVEAGLHLLTR